MAREIVERHGGILDVREAPRRTLFHIEVPLRAPSRADAQRQARRRAVNTKEHLIVYVDDERPNRIVFEQSFGARFNVRALLVGAGGARAVAQRDRRRC